LPTEKNHHKNQYEVFPSGEATLTAFDSADRPVVFQIDRDAIPEIARNQWTIIRLKSGPYLFRKIGTKTVYLHRQLMGAKKGQQVDHRNRNTQDMRKQNLRTCSPKQNMQNRGRFKNNTSGYIGVFQPKKSPNKFYATIKIDGKAKHLGSFDSAETAAIHRDLWALKIQGEFAVLNFEELRESFMPLLQAAEVEYAAAA
jgi:hypothetical protein